MLRIRNWMLSPCSRLGWIFVLLVPLRSPAADALPPPTGIHPIGTSVKHLVDSSRTNPTNKPDSDGRDLTLQFWYPSQKQLDGEYAAYLPDSELRRAMLGSGYFGQPDEVLNAMTQLKSSAIWNANPMKGSDRLPVILLSHGLGMSRVNYTAFAQDWASHGYVVITMDHPCGGFTVTANGRVLSTEDDPALEEEAGFAERAGDWARDAIFVLDHLAESHSQNKIVARLNLQRVGIVGHSLGGVAALEATCKDPRFVAAVNLDGAPKGNIKTSGVCMPSLLLRSEPDYTDEDLKRRGRTREQWDEMGAQIQHEWDDFIAKRQATIYDGSIKGTGHLSYSDAPFVMPNTITRFGGRILQFDRAFEIASQSIRVFFDQQLKRSNERSLTSLRDKYEELRIKQVNGRNKGPDPS